MSKQAILTLNNIDFKVEFFTYRSGRKGFILINPDNDKEQTVCTLDVGKFNEDKNEVIIKNYDNCFGLYETLRVNKFVDSYKRKVQVGVNHGLACNLNDKHETYISLFK